MVIMQHLRFIKLVSKEMNLKKSWVVRRLPKRPKEANKATFGKVLVIAGSKNFPGAAYLACASAYRVGAGLVTLATVPSVKIITSKRLPEVTFISFEEVFKRLGEYDVLLLGPGLGQDSQIIKSVNELLKEKLPKAVIDADGLNILSRAGKWWEKLGEEVILTPHPGEMARLTGINIEKIQSNRVGIAKNFAKVWNKNIILKGANTVIVSSAGKILLSAFANPILATAGTGDVLAGMIAGFLAQGLKPFDAAGVSVYIQAQAGKILQKKLGKGGALASDLLPLLPQIIKNLI